MDSEKLYKWTKKQDNIGDIGVLDNKYDVVEANNMLDNLNQQQQSNNIEDQIIQDNRQKVADNMSPGIEAFSKKQELVRGAHYTYMNSKGQVLQGTRNTPSKYMTPILDNLKRLDDMLAQPFDLKDKDAVHKLFIETILKCEEYISNRNPWTAEGKARLQMVKDFKTQIQDEAVMFEDRVNWLAEHPDEIGENRTWLSILSEIRTEEFINDKDGAKVSIGGNTTSVVYILEKNGTKRYFKQNENLHVQPSVHPTLNKELAALQEKKDKQSVLRAECMEKLIAALTSEYPIELYAFRYVMNHHETDSWRDILHTMFSQVPEYKNMMEKLREAGDDNFVTKEIDFLGEKLLKACRDYKLTNISQESAGIAGGSNISKRNVATSRMAKLLGLDKMVAKASMMNVNANGKKMKGMVMEEVKGKNYQQLLGEMRHHNNKQKSYNKMLTAFYSPNAFKQLLNLQVFDVICGQIDRNATNYLCEHEKNKRKEVYITNIKAIDNDTCFGTLSYKGITQTEKGVHELKSIEKGGEFTIPYMDKALADNILAIEEKEIDYLFCDILNKKEREALIDRINGVKKGIRKKMAEEEKKRAKNQRFTSFFVEDDEKGENWKNAYQKYSDEVNNEYQTAGKRGALQRQFENRSYLQLGLIVGTH